MREIEIRNRKYKIRPLTNGEIKKLRTKHNINLGALCDDNAYEAKDLILSFVLTESEIEMLDALPFAESQKAWTAIMSETFGSEAEEKN